MKKKVKIEPFPPTVTLEQILAYEHGKPETYTSLPLVNAVCEKMFQKDVMHPEYVAHSLGFKRIQLTHAMEVLTGHSLADIRLEMIVKRLCEYRKANPHCKKIDLARVAGYDNTNAYWRFLERNNKAFPELRGEEADLEAHVMSVMEPMMKNEELEVRRLYSILPYRGGREEAAECAKLLYEHACQVADFAQKVLDRHPELKIDRQTLRHCALLHNVGIVWTKKPEIHCHGRESYDSHTVAASAWLRKHQQAEVAFVARFCGNLSMSEDPIANVIAYASVHYSIFNPKHCKTTEEVRNELADNHIVLENFEAQHRLLG